MKVAIAGASGFVGKALILELQKDHSLVALSRSSKKTDSPQLEWRACDLFSLLDAEKALVGVDVAIYLVHSMRPSAHLTQGTFDDFDLIVADNFVRAAIKCGVKQIIYLGGLRPEDTKDLSLHLRSRLEVEDVFRNSGIPFTILRAPIILGAEGSSFHIMARLVERLPVMVTPAWTRTLSQPVSLKDVVASISYCIGNEETYSKTYDLGGPEIVSYSEVMLKIAKRMGLERKLLPFPFVTPRISTLWVCLITGAPSALVKPLIVGLKAPLLVSAEWELKIPNHKYLSIDEAVDEALKEYSGKKSPLAFQGSPSGPHVVRSVQRIPLPNGIHAEQVAHAYLEFLPRTQPFFLRVEVAGNWIYFSWRFPYVRLLILEYSPERSWLNRQLFYVRGGLLALTTERGRLEFREILGGKAVIAAIHDFKPRMPWYIYRWSQALFHLWVMKQFGKYLSQKTPT
ncbi:NAD(P)H-binding protein [Bdellovibrio reynosensis]|uniref:NAD(P)H-binding protein n=1 Tax=Bdellovibrio reynosensis TaxID=2835041 RepID=A0ABY4C6Y6_9BACT|nr:NAD(P)H-binding protein [Bdellovibrio reynosensis]UOF00675.1 NAD(P)H-binding protein [Bdellovibrio reynosensis]